MSQHFTPQVVRKIVLCNFVSKRRRNGTNQLHIRAPHELVKPGIKLTSSNFLLSEAVNVGRRVVAQSFPVNYCKT